MSGFKPRKGLRENVYLAWGSGWSQSRGRAITRPEEALGGDYLMNRGPWSGCVMDSVLPPGESPFALYVNPLTAVEVELQILYGAVASPDGSGPQLLIGEGTYVLAGLDKDPAVSDSTGAQRLAELLSLENNVGSPWSRLIVIPRLDAGVDAVQIYAPNTDDGENNGPWFSVNSRMAKGGRGAISVWENPFE